MTALLRQLPHHFDQIRLAFESDAGKLRHRDETVLYAETVGKSAVRLKQVRIALVAAEAEARGDIERHLLPAMRDAAARRPAALPEHIEGAQVLDQPVRQRAVELQPIAIRPHATIAQQIARVLM